MPDLTITQKALLRFLRHRGPCRISTISAHFSVEYTTARRRAEDLLLLGLVEKVAVGPGAPNRKHVVYQIKETP